MEKLTISKLFAEAAKLLRGEFEHIRSTNPHSVEKGEEIEIILKQFLNQHLPQRFRAGSGIIIDNENKISKQTDVIIYDALSSPVYRFAEKTLIIPVDSVASVVEVKSRLNKNEIKDSFEKIVSCKELKKRQFSRMDQKPTGSSAVTIGTYGIIFGFDSDTSLETLADNLIELNKEYESKLWSDMIVVLDKGVINYGISYPGENYVAGDFALPAGENFPAPPIYVQLIIHKDDEFSLNRFFCNLLSHLTFYPRRPTTPPFKVILEGTAQEVMIITAYQYNIKCQLKPVPTELYNINNPKPSLMIKVSDKNNKQIGIMQYIPWQDGSVIRWYGSVPLFEFLTILLPKTDGISVLQYNSSVQLSSVLSINEEEFRKWPEKLEKNSNLRVTFEEANDI